MVSRRPNPVLLFGAVAVFINVVLFFLLRYYSSRTVMTGSCADLLVTLPAAYYFIVIRSGAQPLITIIPVILSGLLRVTYIASFEGLTKLAVAAACELGIAWFVMSRGRESFAARLFMAELSILRLAFAGWLLKPQIRSGSRTFTMHEDNGTAMIFGSMAVMSLVEAGLMHMVLQRWSGLAAWCLTGLSVYGALLLAALARSFAVFPIDLGDDSLLLRAGMLWSVEVTPANFANIGPVTFPIPERRAPGYVRITGLGEPNLLIELHEPVLAEGLYGRRKLVSRLGVSADDPAGFTRSLQDWKGRNS